LSISDTRGIALYDFLKEAFVVVSIGCSVAFRATPLDSKAEKTQTGRDCPPFRQPISKRAAQIYAAAEPMRAELTRPCRPSSASETPPDPACAIKGNLNHALPGQGPDVRCPPNSSAKADIVGGRSWGGNWHSL
jgi:hypothetical protein